MGVPHPLCAQLRVLTDQPHSSRAAADTETSGQQRQLPEARGGGTGNPAAVQRRPAAPRAEGRCEDSGAAAPRPRAERPQQGPGAAHPAAQRAPRTGSAHPLPEQRKEDGARAAPGERGWRRGTGLRAPSARRTLAPASHQPRTHTAAGISPAAAQQEPAGRP